MKNNMHVYYDEEGDYLELNIGKPRKGVVRDIGKDIFEKIDAKSGKVIGVGIIGFRKRMNKNQRMSFSLPFKISQ